MKQNRCPLRLLAMLLCVALLLPLPAYSEAGEPLTLLLIGQDAAADGQRGRSDTMMLAQIDPEGGSVKLVSFLRDLYVPIAGHGYNRLNAAYVYGGTELLCQTLLEQFGISVHRTAVVDFATMATLIDRVGGVELEITEAERQALNSILATYCRERGLPIRQVESSGLVQLGGPEALSYSRVRSLDSDFQRVNRQQRVLAALLERAMSLDAFSLAGLAVECLGTVETDLTLADLPALVSLLSHPDGPELRTARVPFDGTCRDVQVDGMWVLEADIAQNARLLEAFLAGE